MMLARGSFCSGKIRGITLLDQAIIGGDGRFCSFAAENLW